MRRTTIMLPDDVDRRLRYEASRRDISIAELAREAIERHLPDGPDEGRLGFFAIGDGTGDDVSERVDHYVSEAVGRRRHPTA